MSDEEGQIISGFSKLSKREKIKWIAKNFLYANPIEVLNEFAGFWHDNIEAQKLLDGFSENTLTNFPVPFGIAPNFMINGKVFAVPMVTEESSVVAAASNAAKFWLNRGGFHSEVLSTVKIGQVHFYFEGDKQQLFDFFQNIKEELIAAVKPITKKMEERGGGVKDLELIDFSGLERGYYQIRAYFETVDSMGANFINSCLEEFGDTFSDLLAESQLIDEVHRHAEVIMCILSNYTPECLVHCWVSCPVEDLGNFDEGRLNAADFAMKMQRAVRIAAIDPYRATTHNKGIMNGIDAVVIATGNDFRAVEACAHTYACRDGLYRSLSDCIVENGLFTFSLTLPIAIGTVGGLTSLHPLAKRSLELLGNPNARQLMEIIAAVGLAQNFAAVRSLTTTGIQKGHMKMHLSNICAQYQATEQETKLTKDYFKEKTISVSAVRDYLHALRK